jgi:murein L,D-transpeptidase YafK
MKRIIVIIACLSAFGLLVYGFRGYLVAAVTQPAGKKYTIAERVEQYGKAARTRLKPHFDKAVAVYPPRELCLLGLKDDDRLELYAREGGKWKFLRSYPILAASGNLGPKLREGDQQVPEGVYAIESLNPNSRFHLSLRVNYPNDFDRAQAVREKRSNLGGDIMIHGSSVSIGCLAMGDEAAEDLFVLAADTGIKNITVLLAPVDFRRNRQLPPGLKLPAWTTGHYETLRQRMNELPLPPAK